ncbi:MAG: LysE family translocator [Crocinitomicaceae bacterium]|nr:MAG: LysE family translocator [Crocinitomicaceae bacterium]
MFELTIKGIVTGFILSIMIGPVFFVILETSIRRGVKAALALDLGVLISDLVYILIAYVFYSEVSGLINGENKGILKLIGGILFVIYGAFTYFKKPKEEKVDEVGNVVQNSSDYFMLALKGFLLNFANPLVIFYWFSVITMGAKNSEHAGTNENSILFFLAVILITFFSFDLLKILGAKKLRPLVTEKLLVALNHLIGIVFFGFGVFLVIQGIIGEV